ncbi:hypothetical protein K0B96_15060 [Horticoccus luteus]|uniref:Uncharacterized protein n=1 Tax=Horticoccus luteus TaxID=2862869 RepID=A0A8F9TW05_9BACT|nr:hypothetical protein [Horticoccus luteus]QYM78602.1 hypothetical protein K0B96_15060 [Horticoccus luteus]
MKQTSPFAVTFLMAVAVLFTGCAQTYKASLFIVDDWAPGKNPTPEIIADPVGGYIWGALLRSDKFWVQHISNYFVDPSEVMKIRQGLTVDWSKGKVMGPYQTTEITISLHYGHESAFEAIYRALRDYHAPILAVKRPNSERSAAP